MGWGPAPHLGRGWWLRPIIQAHAQANLSRPLKDVCVCLTWRFILQKGLNLKLTGVCQRTQRSPEHGLEWQLLGGTWGHWRPPLLFYRGTWQTCGVPPLWSGIISELLPWIRGLRQSHCESIRRKWKFCYRRLRLWKKNPVINGKRMLGYKGEEGVAMCEVLGFLREIEAERGHVIDSMTVVDSRLHTQWERGLISQTDKAPHVCECPKLG